MKIHREIFVFSLTRLRETINYSLFFFWSIVSLLSLFYYMKKFCHAILKILDPSFSKILLSLHTENGKQCFHDSKSTTSCSLLNIRIIDTLKTSFFSDECGDFTEARGKKQLSVRRRFDLFPERKVLSRRIVYMEQPRLRVSYNRRKHPTKLKVPSEREIHL